MKAINTKTVFFLSSLSFLFIIFLFSVENYAQNNDPIATVTKVEKKAEFTPPGDEKWELAKNFIQLNESYKLKTHDKALAVVVFNDKSILRVRQNSELIISARKNENKDLDKEANLSKGRTNFEVKNQGDEGSFKFTTPTAVASIRGTDGSIIVGDDGTSLIIVNNGLVDVEAIGGQQQTGNVEGGNSAFVSNDGEITIYETTEEEKGILEGDQKENVRSIVIKTKDGQQVKIDYYGD